MITHCSNTKDLRIYFLCSSVSKEVKRAISRLLQRAAFNGKSEFIDFDAYRAFGKYKSLQNDWTTYGRLLIPGLLKEKKVLYLDTDLLIETDVSALFSTDIENFAVGAVVSTPVQYALEHHFFTNILNIPAHLKVFNAGVLLMNVDAWNKENIQCKLLKLGDRYPQELLSADQALLNAYFAGNFFQLPEKFNVHWYPNKKPPVGHDAIYHFVGSPKPWDFFGRKLHSGYEKWQQYTPGYWFDEVLSRNTGSQLKRFWAIKNAYLKTLLKK